MALALPLPAEKRSAHWAKATMLPRTFASMGTVALVVLALASLLPLSSGLPVQLASADPQIAWKFPTGGEVVSAGALSTDGQTFYVGSRRAAPPPPPLQYAR